MSRIRHNSPSKTLRLAAAAKLARMPGYVRPPSACVDTPLGQRLGIAAVYAGRDDADNARASALLAVADLPDTPANRAAVLASIASIESAVAAAVGSNQRVTQ